MSEAYTEPTRRNLAEESPLESDVPTADLSRIYHDLQALETHPGWIYLKQVLYSQHDKRLIELASKQPYDMRDVVEQALMRGEASALFLLATFPELIAADAYVELRKRGAIESEPEELEDNG